MDKLHVSLKVAAIRERLVANWALVGLCSCVDSQVFLHVALDGALVSAQSALPGLTQDVIRNQIKSELERKVGEMDIK